MIDINIYLTLKIYIIISEINSMMCKKVQNLMHRLVYLPVGNSRFYHNVKKIYRYTYINGSNNFNFFSIDSDLKEVQQTLDSTK